MSNLKNKEYKREEIKNVVIPAIIVKNNQIISKGYNKIEKNNDSTNHAEIIAIKKASKKLKNWRLYNCDMYITLEPCEMCKGAIKNSRIKNVYYIISRENYKNYNSFFQKCSFKEKEYLELLQGFFKNKRK